MTPRTCHCYLQSGGVEAEAELLPEAGAAGGLGEPHHGVVGRDADAALGGHQPGRGRELQEQGEGTAVGAEAEAVVMDAHVPVEALGLDAGHEQEQREGRLVLPGTEGRARGHLAGVAL